jgi:hypothetical protein
MNITNTFNFIILVLQNPVLPDNGKNTDIDAPIDDYINLGLIMAIVIGFFVISKMRKAHSKL